MWSRLMELLKVKVDPKPKSVAVVDVGAVMVVNHSDENQSVVATGADVVEKESGVYRGKDFDVAANSDCDENESKLVTENEKSVNLSEKDKKMSLKDENQSNSENENTEKENKKSLSIIELQDGTKKYLYSGYDADALRTVLPLIHSLKDSEKVKAKAEEEVSGLKKSIASEMCKAVGQELGKEAVKKGFPLAKEYAISTAVWIRENGSAEIIRLLKMFEDGEDN